jgi:PPE-repeat protein
MDFGALPPEINSARTYAGAGCAIDMYTEKSACLRSFTDDHLRLLAVCVAAVPVSGSDCRHRRFRPWG